MIPDPDVLRLAGAVVAGLAAQLVFAIAWSRRGTR
jgi:hypothetical protein